MTSEERIVDTVLDFGFHDHPNGRRCGLQLVILKNHPKANYLFAWVNDHRGDKKFGRWNATNTVNLAKINGMEDVAIEILFDWAWGHHRVRRELTRKKVFKQ